MHSEIVSILFIAVKVNRTAENYILVQRISHCSKIRLL
jgi:hypothetical protein